MPGTKKDYIASISTNVAAVHVGTPAPSFQEWATTKVYFHGFADLPEESVESESFSCLGYEWRVRLCPFAGNEKQKLRIILINRSASLVRSPIDCLILLKDWMDDSIHHATSGKVKTITLHKTFAGFGAYRPVALSSLVNGALVVEVRMKPTNVLDPPFMSSYRVAMTTLACLFNDKESADVLFEVGGLHMHDNETRLKAARTENTVYYAHTTILKNSAPMLAELCKTADNTETIHIPNISPTIFELLLVYIYFGKLRSYVPNTLVDVIKAADQFGIVSLKHQAEARYVSSTNLTLENVMENLHLADSLNCALLKEAVMDYIIKNKVEMLEKKILTDSTIMGLGSDILAAIVRGGKEGGAGGGNKVNYNAMRISELRRLAYSQGLDVDGSREMLISALEEKNPTILLSSESNE